MRRIKFCFFVVFLLIIKSEMLFPASGFKFNIPNKGCVNASSSCFLNSSMQALYSIPELWKFFDEADKGGFYPLGTASRLIIEHLEKMGEAKQPLSYQDVMTDFRQKIVSVMYTSDPKIHLMSSGQRDAQEFTSYLFNKFKEEALFALKNLDKKIEEKIALDSNTEYVNNLWDNIKNDFNSPNFYALAYLKFRFLKRIYSDLMQHARYKLFDSIKAEDSKQVQSLNDALIDLFQEVRNCYEEFIQQLTKQYQSDKNPDLVRNIRDITIEQEGIDENLSKYTDAKNKLFLVSDEKRVNTLLKGLAELYFSSGDFDKPETGKKEQARKIITQNLDKKILKNLINSEELDDDKIRFIFKRFGSLGIKNKPGLDEKNLRKIEANIKAYDFKDVLGELNKNLHIKKQFEEIFCFETVTKFENEYGDQSIKIGNNLMLQLAMPNEEKRSLNELIKMHIKKESVLFSWSKRYQELPSIKQTKFLTLPQILMIQLKRFKTRQDKNYALITIPFGLDMGYYLSDDSLEELTYYAPFAIVIQNGGLDNGHYYTYAKFFTDKECNCEDKSELLKTIDKNWYKYDDMPVKIEEKNSLEIGKILNQTDEPAGPYLIFYRRTKIKLSEEEKKERAEAIKKQEEQEEKEAAILLEKVKKEQEDKTKKEFEEKEKVEQEGLAKKKKNEEELKKLLEEKEKAEQERFRQASEQSLEKARKAATQLDNQKKPEMLKIPEIEKAEKSVKELIEYFEKLAKSEAAQVPDIAKIRTALSEAQKHVKEESEEAKSISVSLELVDQISEHQNSLQALALQKQVLNLEVKLGELKEGMNGLKGLLEGTSDRLQRLHKQLSELKKKLL